MACDSVDFLDYYENLRELIGKWGFSNLKKKKGKRKIGIALLMTHLCKCGRKYPHKNGETNCLLPSHIKIMCTCYFLR